MTTFAVGNRRLLKLAAILDKADAAHKAAGEQPYFQGRWGYPCGTPACALGHWAHANPKRWTFQNYEDGDGAPRLRLNLSATVTGDTMREFAVDSEEAVNLIGGQGCGGAQTGKQAARYIRKFVKARS